MGEVMRILLALITALLLISCGSSKKQVIRDPIFHDQQNFIVFGEDGKESYIMRDPIFSDQQNYLIFNRQEGKQGYLIEDPIFLDEDSWILFEKPKK